MSPKQKVQAQLPPHLDMICQQLVIVPAVDPGVASQYLTPGRQLALDENGQAQLFIPIKNCDHFSTNQGSTETEYGPLSFVTVWLVVQGAFEVPLIPGTSWSYPTFYVQSIGTFFDSKHFWQDMKHIGVDIKDAKRIALGAFGTPGFVHEHGDVGFSWQETVIAPLQPPPGLKIVDYRDGDVEPVVEAIECATSGDVANGYAVVSVGPDSILAPFAQASQMTLYGGTLDADVHCWADVTEQ